MRFSRLFGLVAGTLTLSTPFAAQAQGPNVSPGQYEITTTIVSVDMPGAPPMVAQMMANKSSTMTICITPEMAAKGQTSQAPGKCTMGQVSMAGGKISSSMTCKVGAQTVTTTTSGSYTSDGYETTGTAVMTGARSMTETIKMTGKRIGACK